MKNLNKIGKPQRNIYQINCTVQIKNPKKSHLDTWEQLCAMEISSPPGSPQVLGLSPPHHGSCTWSIIWFIMISVSQKNLQVFGLGSCTWSEHCSVILSLSWPFDYVKIWVSQKIFRYLDSNRHSPYHVPWVKMIVFNCSRNELYSYKKKRSYQCLLQDL